MHDRTAAEGPRPLRVLLVDDDELVRDLVESYLFAAGRDRFALSWCADYDSGLPALLSGRADVALVDFRLGDRSGLELLREAVTLGCRTPMLMLTGERDLALDREAGAAGAADYLVKGEFGPSILERSIRYAVERARVLESLRESEERYALAVRGANDGLWDWKLQDGEIYFSPRWKEILGYADEEIANRLREWYERVHPDDSAGLSADVAEHLEGRTAHLENQHRLLHRDGSYRWVSVRALAVRDTSGRALRLAGSLRDETAHRVHDPLTGLPNRLLYLDRLEHAIKRSRRAGRTFAVLALDVDRFQSVNGSFGHAAGDRLLVETASRIRGLLRAADTAARFGSDEFLLLVEDLVDPNDAVRLADRIREELARPFRLPADAGSGEGPEVTCSASCGIVFSSPRYGAAEEILRDAETALLRAKATGRGGREIFDRAMHERAVAVLSLERNLRIALDRDELVPHFQPIVRLDTGSGDPIVGYEALARWEPAGGPPIGPDEFIPVAEETGLVVPLDRAILRKACLAQVRLGGTDGPFMCVNVSRRQFQEADFVDRVREILEETGADPRRITLEVTETAVMAGAGLAEPICRALRAFGLGLAMDDFGTGYSSLAFCHRLPFTELKIDRSFVSRLETDADAVEIVRAIVGIARGIGARVIAEGVERTGQLERLRDLGCHYAQGFLISRPVPEARIAGIPESRRSLAAAALAARPTLPT